MEVNNLLEVIAMKETMLIALGGNAILRPGQTGTYQEQMENIHQACEILAKLVQAGHKLLITHGNGPQVGNLLIQNEAASASIPPQPLHSCVAQTQGQLGYMIQASLDNILSKKGYPARTASIITRVRVDNSDPAFGAPSKPVGPFFTEEHAKLRTEQGETWLNDSNRGWRRIVPSPMPQEIVELAMIKETLKYSDVTIAAGGGGIPVVREDNQLIGIDAVIDKDLASSLLAQKLSIGCFIIATDVRNAKLNFGKANEIDVTSLTVAEAERCLADNEFGKGSMAPKVLAMTQFVKATGKRGIVASLFELDEAIQGRAGTVIVP